MTIQPFSRNVLGLAMLLCCFATAQAKRRSPMMRGGRFLENDQNSNTNNPSTTGAITTPALNLDDESKILDAIEDERQHSGGDEGVEQQFEHPDLPSVTASSQPEHRDLEETLAALESAMDKSVEPLQQQPEEIEEKDQLVPPTANEEPAETSSSVVEEEIDNVGEEEKTEALPTLSNVEVALVSPKEEPAAETIVDEEEEVETVPALSNAEGALVSPNEEPAAETIVDEEEEVETVPTLSNVEGALVSPNEEPAETSLSVVEEEIHNVDEEEKTETVPTLSNVEDALVSPTSAVKESTATASASSLESNEEITSVEPELLLNIESSQSQQKETNQDVAAFAVLTNPLLPVTKAAEPYAPPQNEDEVLNAILGEAVSTEGLGAGAEGSISGAEETFAGGIGGATGEIEDASATVMEVSETSSEKEGETTAVPEKTDFTHAFESASSTPHITTIQDEVENMAKKQAEKDTTMSESAMIGTDIANVAKEAAAGEISSVETSPVEDLTKAPETMQVAPHSAEPSPPQDITSRAPTTSAGSTIAPKVADPGSEMMPIEENGETFTKRSNETALIPAVEVNEPAMDATGSSPPAKETAVQAKSLPALDVMPTLTATSMKKNDTTVTTKSAAVTGAEKVTAPALVPSGVVPKELVPSAAPVAELNNLITPTETAEEMMPTVSAEETPTSVETTSSMTVDGPFYASEGTPVIEPVETSTASASVEPPTLVSVECPTVEQGTTVSETMKSPDIDIPGLSLDDDLLEERDDIIEPENDDNEPGTQGDDWEEILDSKGFEDVIENIHEADDLSKATLDDDFGEETKTAAQGGDLDIHETDDLPKATLVGDDDFGEETKTAAQGGDLNIHETDDLPKATLDDDFGEETKTAVQGEDLNIHEADDLPQATLDDDFVEETKTAAQGGDLQNTFDNIHDEGTLPTVGLDDDFVKESKTSAKEDDDFFNDGKVGKSKVPLDTDDDHNGTPIPIDDADSTLEKKHDSEENHNIMPHEVEEKEIPQPSDEDDLLFADDEAIEKVIEEKEKKEATQIGSVAVLLAMMGMICTAHQVSENPDGAFASFCRLTLTVWFCVVRVICFPFSFLFGKRRNGHRALSTVDYREQPYRGTNGHTHVLELA